MKLSIFDELQRRSELLMLPHEDGTPEHGAAWELYCIILAVNFYYRYPTETIEHAMWTVFGKTYSPRDLEQAKEIIAADIYPFPWFTFDEQLAYQF